MTEQRDPRRAPEPKASMAEPVPEPEPEVKLEPEPTAAELMEDDQPGVVEEEETSAKIAAVKQFPAKQQRPAKKKTKHHKAS